MSIMRRLLGIARPYLHDDEHVARMARSAATIERERQEYRQTIQRVGSGARLLSTWEGAMKIMRKNGDA